MSGMTMAAAIRWPSARVSRVAAGVWLAARGKTSETATRTSAVRRKARAGSAARAARIMARIVPATVAKTTPTAKLAGVMAWAWLAPGSPARIGTERAWASAP
jgi:hypothetical protein